MSNNINSNPLILDTASASAVGVGIPIKVSKIVWEGTTIAAGSQVVIQTVAGTTLFETTASASTTEVPAGHQRIEYNFFPEKLFPATSGSAGGWALTTLSTGILYIYYNA
jgi:hypothetical protein